MLLRRLKIFFNYFDLLYRVEEKYCLLSLCAPVCLDPSSDRDGDGSENPDGPVTLQQQLHNNSQNNSTTTQHNQTNSNTINLQQNESMLNETILPEVSMPHNEEVNKGIKQEVKRLLATSDKLGGASVVDQSEASLYETLDQLITLAATYSTTPTLECRPTKTSVSKGENISGSSNNNQEHDLQRSVRIKKTLENNRSQEITDPLNSTVYSFEIVDGVGVSTV